MSLPQLQPRKDVDHAYAYAHYATTVARYAISRHHARYADDRSANYRRKPRDLISGAFVYAG